MPPIGKSAVAGPNVDVIAQMRGLDANFLHVFDDAARSLQALIDGSDLDRLRDFGAQVALDPSRLAGIGAAIPSSVFEQVRQWASAHADVIPTLEALTPERFGLDLDANGAAAWERFSAKTAGIASGQSTEEDSMELAEITRGQSDSSARGWTSAGSPSFRFSRSS